MSPGRDELVAPTRDDPFVAASSPVVGGVLGDHARSHPVWTALRVVLALVTLTSMLWLARSAPCAGADGAWWSSDRFSDLCYSDVPLRYTDNGLAERTPPYGDTQGRYPAGTDTPPVAAVGYVAAVVAQGLTGAVVDGRDDVPVSQLSQSPEIRSEATTYFFVVVLLLFGCALATTALIAGGSGRRRWDAAAFAAAPALLLAGTIGWDLLAVALAVGAWFAWTRGRPVVCGVLAGLAVATSVWPLALVAAVVVVGVRTGRGQDAGLTALGTVTSWAVLQLPVLRLGLDGWWATVNTRLGDPPGYGSLWGVAADGGHALDADLMARVVLLAGAVITVVVGWLAWRSARPRVAQLTLLLLVGWLVVWPVYSPQQVLWLLPFAVLARPRWADLLAWQAAEVFYFLAIWMHLSGATTDSGQVDRVYATAVVVRVVAELWFASRVVRDLREPWFDPVHSPGGGGQDRSTSSKVDVV